MKKMIYKNLVLFVLVSFFVSFVGYNYVSAEDEDKSLIDPYIGDNLSMAKCFAKGNTDILLFLNTIIFNDGIKEGIIEPWKDVLSRNKCQMIDVVSLIKQQDKIRKYIRDAFLTCNNQKLDSLKRAFNTLNAEIYYVRHVVDGSIVISLPYDILSTRILEDPESMFYPTQKLYNEMFERYVNGGDFEKGEFDVFFAKLGFKYKDRKNTYVLCENDSWEEVSQKWSEFIESIGGLAPAWKNLEKGIAGRAEKIVEATTDQGIVAYLSGIIQINLNNMALKPGFEEVLNSIEKYVPNVDVPTQSQLLRALDSADSTYNTAQMRQSLVSEFEVLYKDINDSGVSIIVNELDLLNETLDDSFSPLNGILDCSRMMNFRQCPQKR